MPCREATSGLASLLCSLCHCSCTHTQTPGCQRLKRRPRDSNVFLSDARRLSDLLSRCVLNLSIVYGTVHGTQYTVHGTRHTVHGTRYTVHGTRCTVHGTRCTVMWCIVVAWQGNALSWGLGARSNLSSAGASEPRAPSFPYDPLRPLRPPLQPHCSSPLSPTARRVARRGGIILVYWL